MRISVIIAAAGSSQRMGTNRSKVLLPLGNKPVLAWSLELFQQDPDVTEILVTASEKDRAEIAQICRDYSKSKATTGGSSRSLSVVKALSQVDSTCDKVAVHDGARPLLSRNDWEALKAAAQEKPAVVPLTAATDSMKAVVGEKVAKTLPRANVAAVQTPQIFNYQILLQAYKNALQEGLTATDDSELVEQLNVPVAGVYTKDPNLKITYRQDLLLAEILLDPEKRGEIEK